MLKNRGCGPLYRSKEYRGHARNKRFNNAVVLLEHEGQVRNYLKRFKQEKGQKLIIAASPFAIYELDKRGLPYRILEDYYDPKELYKLGISNYKKVENLSNIVDGRIQNACPAIAELDIRPALFSFYHLKIIYDAATIRLFQLSKLIDAENPDTLYVYNSERYPFGISEMAPYLLFDNRESIYARLLACEGWGVPVVMLPRVSRPEDPDFLKKPQPEAKTLRKRVMWGLRRYPRLFDLAAEVQTRGWRELFRGLKSYPRVNKGTPVILFGAGYNWDDCREELQSVGIDPRFIRIWDNPRYWIDTQTLGKPSAGALTGAWKELQTDEEFRKFFVWRNVDFFPVLEARLRFLVERLTSACLNVYEETAKTIKNRKVRAFLAPGLASCTSRSAALAAQNSNIPVVTWQHGSYGYMDYPITVYNDLMGSDVHFVFGDGVVDKYAKTAERLGTQLVAVGSSSLENLFQMSPLNKVKKIVKLTPGKKVVLYTSTTFYQNHLCVSFPPPFSDNHLWYTQRAILEGLAKHSDYTIVVKTHPSRMHRESPMHLYAKENRFENIQFIKDECTFTDLLPIADLFVIDFPSTTIMEVLTTSKPIFVYTGHLRLDARALKLLERRAFCYPELKSFVDALDKYLSTGKIDKRVNLNDKSFLKAYGISSQEAGSRTRAAKTLKQIIRAPKGNMNLISDSLT
jgi:hypothetical protein